MKRPKAFSKIGAAALFILVAVAGFATPSPGVREAADIDQVPGAENMEEAEGGPPGLYGGRALYDDVVLIVNDNSDISREIGTYFAQRRGLPPENIINISTSTSETITAAQFDQVAAVIKANLTGRGMADRINYLVTTKGVPLRVSGATNARASFDSELALVGGQYESSIHQNLWIENPYYRDMGSFSFMRVGMRLVTRLTGYTVEDARRLVDLAEMSYGARGNGLMDLDPGKDGSPGYKIGNDWMRGADTWLKANGHPSLLDENSTFRTGFSDLMAYNSWGSNDGNWNHNFASNPGFEYGAGDQASSWTYVEDGGSVSGNSSVFQAGTRSLRLERAESGPLLAYQEMSIPFVDHRYIIQGYMKLENVGSGGAVIRMEGRDAGDGLVSIHDLRSYTGTRDWTFVQGVMENTSTTGAPVEKLRIYVELVGDGTVFFDSLSLRAIRPHNTWVPGAIAETCVSTGGRSFNYGTTYGQSLVADLIRDGVTGVKGYVYEPYLSAISHADILFPDYYSGANLAESYYAGSQLASWMGTVVGDPKCAPFIDLRPDPGIADEPYTYGIDENGDPYLIVHLVNDADVETSVFNTYVRIDDVLCYSGSVSIEPRGRFNITVDLDRHGDISGIHTLSISLDPNRMIRDGNESNNRFEGQITVNTKPVLDHIVSPAVVLYRTESIGFQVLVNDPDEMATEAGMNISIKGPPGISYIPALQEVAGTPERAVFTYIFQVPWDAPLSTYDLWYRYTDENGSWEENFVERLILVLNNEPSLNGSVSAGSISRGGSFDLDLRWEDVDTPNGSLTLALNVFGRNLGNLEPIQSFIGSHNASYTFVTSPDVVSDEIEVRAKVIDRDGATSEWLSTVSTVNSPPQGTITGGPYNVSRLETAEFLVTFTDPEGMDSRDAKVHLRGPVDTEIESDVESFKLDLRSGEEHSLLINCSMLPIGRYDLIFFYEDDELADGIHTYENALTVHNVKPEVTGSELFYLNIFRETGYQVLRGHEVTLRVFVEDLDDPGYGLYLDGILKGPAGEAVEQITFSRRGEILFEYDLATYVRWLSGGYSIELTLVDDQMHTDVQVVENMFVLYTEPPGFGDVTVSREEDGSVRVDVVVTQGAGGSLPSSLTAELSDANGTIISSPLISSGGLVWFQVVEVSRVPEKITLTMVDDEDRTFTWNGSLNLQVADGNDTPLEQVSSDESSTLPVLIAVTMIVLLLVAVVIFFVILMRTSRKGPSPQDMMMAPPPPPPGMVAGAPKPELPAVEAPPEDQEVPPHGEPAEHVEPPVEPDDGIGSAPDPPLEEGASAPDPEEVSGEEVPLEATGPGQEAAEGQDVGPPLEEENVTPEGLEPPLL